MTNWIKNENVILKTVRDAQFNPLDLKKFKSRNSAIFKGFITLIMKNGSKDFINGRGMHFQSYENEQIDMHHIFPQKFWKKQDEKIYSADKWKSILNQTPISSESNKFIAGNSPRDYCRKILTERKVSSCQKLNEILKSHGIELEDLRGNNFEKFIVNRVKFLLDIVEQTTGKKILGRDSEEVIQFFEQAI